MVNASVETPFSIEGYVRWADLDANGHLANVGFLNAAVDCRMRFFEAHGLPVERLAELGIGPVVQRDEVDYRRELRLLQPYTVTMTMAAMAPDGSRFRLRNAIVRQPGGAVAAVVTSITGFLDLRKRCLVAPPPDLLGLLRAIPREPDFEELAPLG